MQDSTMMLTAHRARLTRRATAHGEPKSGRNNEYKSSMGIHATLSPQDGPEHDFCLAGDVPRPTKTIDHRPSRHRSERKIQLFRGLDLFAMLDDQTIASFPAEVRPNPLQEHARSQTAVCEKLNVDD